MIKQTLMETLTMLATSTPETALLLKKLFVPVFFRKGTLFHIHERASPMLYFIETGLVRGYFYYKQEEYTAWLMESGFLLPAAGFFTKVPAIEYVHFLTDTNGSSLNLEIAVALAQEHPLLYRMLLEIYERDLQAGKHRELMLRLKLAENRFLYAREICGKLFFKVVNPVMASFMNIEKKYIFKFKKIHRK
ncbi:CRP-like cAMP-binding protein [Pedobacter sp. AK017]|uniref:Crp/Fnr family transcriptional regulator n=1 Tax=Pedobacter sp. AK017 TaxID=2723073 RepID=UPI00161A833F|nr:hypothetical protein [Pedobacter sp. AK017]MBB5436944.1 CRP-like cAMP-binding protein [Pedobacter sp. AK017]